jgi:epoxyqueuosine reductase
MGGLRELVVARGRANGLDAVGIAGAEPFERTRSDLLERRAAGLHADMQFTYRDPDRSTDPSRTLPGARSLVVGAVRYASRTDESDAGAADRPGARVARYATGDHEAVLRQGLAAVAEDLRHAGFRAVVLTDDNALVDRAAAHRAGIGWFGKSSNLLLPDRGSWFVLGSVLTDAELEPAAAPVGDGCGSCRRCIDGCPTGAIVADGVVDARRCLSWLLQSPGTFPREHRVALGDRIYGCDDCQEVCPPNRRSDRRGEGDGVRARPARPGRIPGTGRIDVLWMLRAEDADLLEAAGRWYVPDRDPDHLRRNALLVLGNTADGDAHDVVEVLRAYLRHPVDTLASHATWAALQLDRADLLDEPGVAGRPAVDDERARWPGARTSV